MQHFLHIYSDENINTWIERLFHSRYVLGLNYEESKEFLTEKYEVTDDEFEGICELVDVKLGESE